MNNLPLVSVIVPVYNVEQYLHRSIDSLLVQTYKNLEILIIDDGSTDGSAAICDYYASYDARIRVFHKENGGQSDARNMALERMTGDYVTFVDSDDYVASDMIEKFYNAIKTTGAEMVVGGYYVVNHVGEIYDMVCINIKQMLSGEEVAKNIIQDLYPKNFAWGKMYKSSLFEDICFPVGRLYEDTAIVYRIADKCNLVCCLPDNLYYYEMRRAGNTTSELQTAKAIKSYIDGIINCHERLNFIEQRPNYADVRFVVIEHLHQWALLALQSAMLNGYESYCQVFQLVRKAVSRYMDKPRKKSLQLALVYPKIYYFLYSGYKRICKK